MTMKGLLALSTPLLPWVISYRHTQEPNRLACVRLHAILLFGSPHILERVEPAIVPHRLLAERRHHRVYALNLTLRVMPWMLNLLAHRITLLTKLSKEINTLPSAVSRTA